MKKEFSDQPAILRYIEKNWVTLRNQWACCYTRFYKNFGARVTSPTESTNLNAKSYLINGRASVLRLVEALQALAHRQIKVFNDRRAQQAIRTRREFLGRAYLGSLPTKVSYKALEPINHE